MENWGIMMFSGEIFVNYVCVILWNIVLGVVMNYVCYVIDIICYFKFFWGFVLEVRKLLSND